MAEATISEAIPRLNVEVSGFVRSVSRFSENVTELPDHPTAADWLTFLQQVLADFGCVTGTLHRLDPANGLLKLVACQGIPEVLMPVVRTIPVGKGVAGAAAERRGTRRDLQPSNRHQRRGQAGCQKEPGAGLARRSCA